MTLNLTHKWKIGTKLQFSYLLLIVMVAAVTAVSFRTLSARYLIHEAQRQMKSDAAALAEALQGSGLLDADSVADLVKGRRQLKAAGRLLDTKIVVRNANGKLVYTNLDRTERGELRVLAGGGTLDETSAGTSQGRYLIERRAIVGDGGSALGQVTLAAKLDDISGLDRLLRRAQLVSIAIGVVIALGIGYVLGRSLSGPITGLAARMRQFSPKRALPGAPLSGGDEIGELSRSFYRMAEELRDHDRMQTDFLQNASHELKTPLMAIQGNAEAVKDGIVTGEEAERSLDVIIQECQDLKRLVDEMIYLTRLEAVRESYTFEWAAIGEILGEAVSAIRGAAERRHIALSVTGDTFAEGDFDRDKLKWAFLNLLGNSVRYARSRISLRVSRQGSRLEIVCADDGPGFKPGEELKVFDRFYTGDQGGTGIGLAIAKAVIEGHGGAIQAMNSPDGGAMFKVTLELMPARQRDDANRRVSLNR